MLQGKITVLVQYQVNGPGGIKLLVGKVHEFDDSPYVRLLIKSGTVTLIDPPSLDSEFLEKAGYETVKNEEKPIESYLTRVPKKRVSNSKETLKK